MLAGGGAYHACWGRGLPCLLGEGPIMLAGGGAYHACWGRGLPCLLGEGPTMLAGVILSFGGGSPGFNFIPSICM